MNDSINGSVLLTGRMIGQSECEKQSNIVTAIDKYSCKFPEFIQTIKGFLKGLDGIREITRVQIENLKTAPDYEYNRGLTNGLILAMSILTNDDNPQFIKKK